MVSDEMDDESVVSDSSLDSDDPENWGPYYWSSGEDKGVLGKIGDNLRYRAFTTFKRLEFAGDVLSNFFGLDQSRFQWVIDTLEKDMAEEKHQELIYAQRKEMELRQNMQKDSERVELMEGGKGI